MKNKKSIANTVIIISILLNIILGAMLIGHKVDEAKKYTPYNNLRPRIEREIISDYLRNKGE